MLGACWALLSARARKPRTPWRGRQHVAHAAPPASPQRATDHRRPRRGGTTTADDRPGPRRPAATEGNRRRATTDRYLRHRSPVRRWKSQTMRGEHHNVRRVSRERGVGQSSAGRAAGLNLRNYFKNARSILPAAQFGQTKSKFEQCWQCSPNWAELVQLGQKLPKSWPKLARCQPSLAEVHGRRAEITATILPSTIARQLL